jgi:hypothetical protein
MHEDLIAQQQQQQQEEQEQQRAEQGVSQEGPAMSIDINDGYFLPGDLVRVVRARLVSFSI